MHTAGASTPSAPILTPSPLADKPGDALDEAKKLHKDKKYAESLAVFQKIAAHDPKNAEAFNGMGLCYHAMGKADLAVDAFQKAIERDPKISRFYYNLARAYGSKQQFDLALISYKKAIKDNPKHGLAHFEMGNIYFMKKEFAKAKEHYEKAAESFGEKTPPGQQALRNAIKSEMLMQKMGN
jgi:tetratricopeptide (TPR) repeat protein